MGETPASIAKPGKEAYTRPWGYTDIMQTMIWPVKRNSPNELIKKNEEQANAIANRVKALNHGRCLSTKELRASNDDDIRRLGEYLEGQIGTLGNLAPLFFSCTQLT